MPMLVISGPRLKYRKDFHRELTESSWLTKKNVFISRGWGAAGMPLAPGTKVDEIAERSWGTNEPKLKLMRQLVAQGYDHRSYGAHRNYSIPQLFVSYGWGPMG